MITLPHLPYALDALEPILSARTLSFHYEKHHDAYVNKVNALLPTAENENLEHIIKKASTSSENIGLFQNAAQVWNHTFYWHCLCSPKDHGHLREGNLKKAIEQKFRSVESFVEAFIECALTQFGSGWAWLVKKSDGTVDLRKTGNADLPFLYGEKALFTCDVWEHAYYLDYQNRRKEYVEAILHNITHWEFVEKMYDEPASF